VRVPSPCKRAGVSSIPPIGLMPQRWCGRSTSSSTLSSTAWRSKIASMIDEHTRESLLNLVERSITAERLVTELAAVVAVAGGAADGAADGPPSGVGLSSAATVLRWQGRLVLHSARLPVGQRLPRIVQQPATQGVPRPQPLDHPVRGPRWSSATSNTSTTTDTGIRPGATERRPRRLRQTGIPTPRWPARSTESETQQPDSNSGWTQQQGLATGARGRRSTETCGGEALVPKVLLA
jgi:hypothetical protein